MQQRIKKNGAGVSACPSRAGCTVLRIEMIPNSFLQFLLYPIPILNHSLKKPTGLLALSPPGNAFFLKSLGKVSISNNEKKKKKPSAICSQSHQ